MASSLGLMCSSLAAVSHAAGVLLCFHCQRMQDIQAIPSSILDVWISWECFTPQLLLTVKFHTSDCYFWQLPLFC